MSHPSIIHHFLTKDWSKLVMPPLVRLLYSLYTNRVDLDATPIKFLHFLRVVTADHSTKACKCMNGVWLTAKWRSRTTIHVLLIPNVTLLHNKHWNQRIYALLCCLHKLDAFYVHSLCVISWPHYRKIHYVILGPNALKPTCRNFSDKRSRIRCRRRRRRRRKRRLVGFFTIVFLK